MTYRILPSIALIGLVLVAPFGALTPAALAQTPPRLATLVIDIWAEYDVASTVLVIYRGQFSPNAPVPSQVTLRIPATAGDPSAVASPQPGNETTSVNQWSVIQATTTRSGDWTLVTFAPLSRLFTIEFYDKLGTVTFDRSYKLTWPGDLAADAVTLNVREPVGAANFQFTPALPAGVIDEEGFVFHQLGLGTFEAGKPVVFSANYTRQDKRPSVQVLQLATPAPASRVATPSAQAGTQNWPLIILLVAGLVLVVAGGAVWYTRSQQTSALRPYKPPAFRHEHKSVRTSRAPRARPRPAATITPTSITTRPEAVEAKTAFCTQCGKSLQPDDLYCSRCGTRVKGK